MAHLWGDVLAIFLFGWVAAMIPGPDTAMILRNCLVFSRRDGFYTALGICTGLCVHTVLALAGIGVLIARSLLLFTLLKWAGAAFLVYLGVHALLARRAPQPDAAEPAPEVGAVAPAARRAGMGAIAAFRLGFLTNVLNPKAPLYLLAAFTQVVHAGTPLPMLAVFGAEIALAALLWYVLLTAVLSHPRVRGPLAAARRWIERIAGAVFIALGVRLALARAQ
jgi:RhtB (resistance to homoserine/threonine) family protein